MENWEKIYEASKELNLSGSTVSSYGVIDGVNVRLSDHLPKVHNLVDYADRLSINDNNEANILIYVVSNDDDDQSGLELYIKDAIECEVDVTANVTIVVSDDFDLSYFRMKLRTL